jgi:dynein assembly factor with WDR repeat domains 1
VGLILTAGHEGDVTKVLFNPQGTKIMTAGFDKTARLWNSDTSKLLEVLEGHEDEIFSCSFNYQGDTIITGSKDNTCIIWRDSLTWDQKK